MTVEITELTPLKCSLFVDTAISKTKILDVVNVEELDVEAGTGGTNIADVPSTINSTGITKSYSSKEFCVRMIVCPFAMFSNNIIITRLNTSKYIRHNLLQQKAAHDSSINSSKNKDSTQNTNAAHVDELESIVTEWKKQLRSFISHDISIQGLKQDNFISFGILLNSLLLLFLLLLFWFESPIHIEDASTAWYTLFMLVLLILGIITMHSFYRQRLHNISMDRITTKLINIQPYRKLLTFVLLIFINCTWITTNVADRSGMNSGIVVLDLCLTLSSLFSVGMCFFLACDNGCLYDNGRREEALKNVHDKIISMNHGLTNLTCDPIIRSEYSNISVHMYDKTACSKDINNSLYGALTLPASTLASGLATTLGTRRR